MQIKNNANQFLNVNEDGYYRILHLIDSDQITLTDASKIILNKKNLLIEKFQAGKILFFNWDTPIPVYKLEKNANVINTDTIMYTVGSFLIENIHKFDGPTKNMIEGFQSAYEANKDIFDNSLINVTRQSLYKSIQKMDVATNKVAIFVNKRANVQESAHLSEMKQASHEVSNIIKNRTDLNNYLDDLKNAVKTGITGWLD